MDAGFPVNAGFRTSLGGLDVDALLPGCGMIVAMIAAAMIAAWTNGG